MTVLNSQTTFNIVASPEAFEESVDLYLFPENSGMNAFRELHYPGDKYPPIVYDSNPLKWENFDSVPMTDRPMVKTEFTISWAQSVQWKGYMPDTPVREFWTGSETESLCSTYFLRRLYEYFIDPPVGAYITWWPKDRTAQGYNILVETITVNGQNDQGQDIIMLLDAALRADLVAYEVIFQFRIVGEADS